MKRRILLFALALVAGALLSPVATAKPVSMHDARRAVAVFLHVDEGALTPLHSPFSTLHLFAVDGRGFAIAAADDRVLPVLGYSLNAPLKDADTPIPENMRRWLDGYDAHIQAVTADESLPPHPQWALLLAGSAPKAVYNTAVGPLLTTTWGHLTDYEPTFFLSNPDVSWYIRCITSSAGEPLGISPVAASSSPLTCYFEGLNLRVENPGGETVRLHDITGRCLSISNATHTSFSVPAPGVYILRAGTRPALKVVAVKQ